MYLTKKTKRYANKRIKTLQLNQKHLNPFSASIPILYLLKTKVSGDFRGHKIGTLARNRLTYFMAMFLFTSMLSTAEN